MIHVELHDKNGRVEIEELSALGRQEAAHQCQMLIEELQAADADDNDEDEDDDLEEEDRDEGEPR